MSAARRLLSKAEFFGFISTRTNGTRLITLRRKTSLSASIRVFSRNARQTKTFRHSNRQKFVLISFNDLQRLYGKIRFGRLIAEEIFVDSIQQLASFYQDKPAVRYRNFVHRFPQLVQRLPQYYIASYKRFGRNPFDAERRLARRQCLQKGSDKKCRNSIDENRSARNRLVKERTKWTVEIPLMMKIV